MFSRLSSALSKNVELTNRARKGWSKFLLSLKPDRKKKNTVIFDVNNPKSKYIKIPSYMV